MNRLVLILILFVFLVFNMVQAQVSHGGRPLPFAQTKSSFTGFFEEMPSFDVAEELRIDALNESDLRGGYRFAYKFMTGFNRNNSGTSFYLPDGTFVWRLGIRSKDALSINILFSEYELPDGAQVFLYNPEQTQVLGSFTSQNNSELDLLPVAPLYGDELIVEYHEPANAAFPGRLTVGEVNHGYRDFRGFEPDGDYSTLYCMPSPICFQDDEQYKDIVRSTVLLIVDGVEGCTGVLLNNTANDGKPYLLTATHCLNKQFAVSNPDYESIAGRIICYFNYESPTCQTAMRGTEEMSVASTFFKAVYEKLDMALLELIETPPVYYRPYYAGWDISETGGTPPYNGIHHPRKSFKRVNITESNISLKTFEPSLFTGNSHWYVGRWDVGCTAGGSSGSPLFDSNNRVVGALSGGRSSCTSPVDDYYYALFKAWTPSENTNEQLKHWLDPLNRDQLTLDGLDPYSSGPGLRLSNMYDLKLQDSIEVTELASPASGKLFGINSTGTTEYAEEYTAKSNAFLYGAYLVTPAITDAAASLDVDIMVYSGDSNGPRTLLHTKKFHPTFTNMSFADSTLQETEKGLNRAQESFVLFDEAIELSGTFYIGYKIKSPANSSFAVYNLPQGETTRNTAWVHTESKWIKASAHSVKPMSTSLFIDPVIQYADRPSNETIAAENPVKVYFETGSKNIHIVISGENPKGVCSLYTAGGSLLLKTAITDNQTTIPVPDVSPGIYMLHVSGNSFSHTRKMIF